MHFCRAMSGARKHAAATGQQPLCVSAAASERPDLCRNVSKHTQGKTAQSSTAAGCASPRFTDLKSPKRRTWLTGGSNSDSPGDLEPSQDIIWDSTSPKAVAGFRCKKVEISDIVNRIAPKDVKPHKSSLLQWIGDSAVPCTPDIPKHRTRKKSSRPNSVDDLMRLARQFDENMQQDNDMNEKLNLINNNKGGGHSVDPKEQEQPALSCDSGEAELRALFDGSTQKVCGPLSQSSLFSPCSREVAHPPEMPSSHNVVKAEENTSSSLKASESNKCDDFDDDWDWDNDELLNDSLLMAISPEQQGATTKTSLQSITKCIPEVKPSTNANHAPKMTKVHIQPSYSALQALCPKPKTTNRSTFKLGPDPVIQPPIELPNQPPKSKFTDVKSSSKSEPVVSADDFSDGDDDLLYQVCDTVERISNSQPQKEKQSDNKDKWNMAVNPLHKATIPVPTTATTNSVNKHSAGFVRFNSLPVMSSTPNDQPMKSSSIRAQISQSLPGNHMSAGSLSHINHNPSAVKPIQKSSNTTFKRNVSDSAMIRSKVFITNEKMGKCSAAEIEKKKQEALARRRQRVQNSQK